jgi:3-deoxy-D-manno-octulosonic-acid transferase
MLPVLYRILGTASHALLSAVLPIVNYTVPGWEIEQRLGKYQHIVARSGPLLWIHAASVGEVQAARVLIAALTEQIPGCRFFLTAMTRQGLEAAADSAVRAGSVRHASGRDSGFAGSAA